MRCLMALMLATRNVLRYKSVASPSYLFITQFSILRCSHRIPRTRSTTTGGRLMPHTCAVEAHHYAYIGAACRRLPPDHYYHRYGRFRRAVSSTFMGWSSLVHTCCAAATCVPVCVCEAVSQKAQNCKNHFGHKFPLLWGPLPALQF